MPRWLLVVLAVPLAAGLWLTQASAGGVSRPQAHQIAHVAAGGPVPAVPDWPAQEAAAALAERLQAEQWAVEYALQLANEAAEQAAAARAAAVRASQPSQQRTYMVGDCSAFLAYVPAWIIDRESRGDPNAVNGSSGAMGCVQELPGHFAEVSPWNSNAHGTCYGLDPNTQAGQLECANRLSSGGSNLNPWAF